MPYISNKERMRTTKKVISGNTGKKIFITLTFILWLAMVVLFLAASYLYGNDPQKYSYFSFQENDKITTYGIGMTCFAGITLLFTIISVIAVWCFKSPKSIAAKTSTLIKTPLPGKKKK